MRLTEGGRIDRSKTLRFTFDGRSLTGHPGDTLASALLANGVRLAGRSFKYHRPRGILTAGSEEPNALVQIGSGARLIPNCRATVQELYQGLHATSQNAWPSLRYDLMAVNDLAAPFLGAGFYYKTFMWPPKWWERVYEPVIRRAAGLGSLTPAADPYLHEKAFAECDLLVIGAGPAGLMAALTAGEAGADVILADEQTEPGGRLLSEAEQIDGAPAIHWVDRTMARLRAMPNVRVLTRTTVTGAYDQGSFGALERVSEHLAQPGPDLPRDCFWRIRARASVLAAGAIERPVAFADNDRPGIMMASAVRSYLHRYGVSPGKSVAVFAAHDDAHRTVRDLLAAGVRVAAVIDPRANAPIPGGVPGFRNATVIGTTGRRGLTSIRVATPDGEHTIVCDTLAMSGGWNPYVHLTCHLGARPVWNDAIHAFVPVQDAVPGMVAAGACRGAFSTRDCLAEGHAAASTALATLGRSAPSLPLPLPEAESDAGRAEPLWQVEGKGRAWLDFQNDVTVKDVTQSAQEGFSSVEHMKRYTTQGMAPDQGKSSNIGALAVLADATGRTIPETGTTTYRPPFVPLPLGAVGAGAENAGFAPQRFTTSHAASVARHAPMIEAGLWYRPSYFPAAGEHDWLTACNREVRMVRDTVGICDVSTLGKIEFRGPDSGALLDFVYANGFSGLKPGRARYGIMLREDGHVMDDGTTARLSEDHWVMTTTTAAAGQVMAHLEMVQQCHLPRLRTRFTSTTDAWAQFAIAGPRSRELVTALAGPVDLPFMGCAEVSVCGVPGRLFRISFSGEHAYELAVPARFGASLFDRLLTEAESRGGGPYGMEALNVLRIEKGFLTHAELHGRTTAFDLGMQGMMSRRKNFIGKAAATRPGLLESDRERLVGLVPVEPGGRLTAGAHLYEDGAEAIRANNQGYLTSACYSPTLGHALALGFLRNGPARMGERIRMMDAVRGVTTLCRVTHPVFFDPEGGRARD